MTRASSDLDDINITTLNFYSHLNNLQSWFNLCRVKINSRISLFTLILKESPLITFNNKIVQVENSVKYLGIYPDEILTWTTHIKTKRIYLKQQLHYLKQLFRSNTSHNNEILLHKQFVLQRHRPSKLGNKTFYLNLFIDLQLQTNASWYVSNRCKGCFRKD